MSPTPDWVALRAAAAEAARRSYSPYSGFPVGAAALLADGSTISAANVENASYTVGICAETALVGVLVAGGRGRGDLVAVAVTDPDGNDLSACGRCRQLLHEMGGGPMPLNERPMDGWLPDAFGPEDLT
ncbi:cytidine deaminase [Acidimicrobiia bacterium EGI L10123]|uniref:cytidine deaminase n=1 Tax=Salinilacustrithrix flava TaxID=2957203 RepID=UPI003D7C15A3|nr:cytidine deaminase [Acidimicrobiia bacterium EGI L10123]